MKFWNCFFCKELVIFGQDFKLKEKCNSKNLVAISGKGNILFICTGRKNIKNELKKKNQKPRDRYRHRQRDIFRHIQRDKYRHRQIDRYRHRQRERYRHRQSDRYRDRQRDRYRHRQRDRYRYRQI